MKVTKAQLKQIIKEELEAALDEYHSGLGSYAPRGPVFKRDTEEDDDPLEEEELEEKKKDDNWLKDVKSTGECTPIGKSTCTGRKKTFAKYAQGNLRKTNLKRGKNPHGPG